MPSKHSHSGGRSAAGLAGVLLIAGLVTGIFSVVPVIDAADYLTRTSANENQVLLGAVFQLGMVVAYVGIPIVMYPIFCKQNKGLALGSVAFGIISGMFLILGVLLLLLLLTVSHEFAIVGALSGSSIPTVGELLRTGRDLVNHVATTLSFVAALFMLNCLLYQTKWVPRWLSASGLVGSALSILASLLFMIRFIGLDATYMTLNLPIALQQFVLAIWLILKGFNRGKPDAASI
ncbi:DUF4386 domain-containing protein [Paenibacillus oceani]|uniref:DUF4386 domain-containing protein n=1 Tax=Paenibacillus oceani TaxID=2772510 RepID=A0A927CFL3_9BACL|nr:DUF4386 domain-containing protein [Paenibacillus oceani]MBD2865076.1 DUF4386 domain-containing protein [Paenibacillus oceani]